MLTPRRSAAPPLRSSGRTTPRGPRFRTPRRPVLAALAVLTGAVLAATGQPSTAVSPTPARAHAAAGAPTFRIATFNLLGYSHTQRGRQAYMGSGVTRMHRAVGIINRRKLGLVGFQEMQEPQVAEFLKLKGSSWDLYPGTSLGELDGENSIGWRTDTWRLLKASTTPIPYFGGHIRNMPVLLLQHIASGRRIYVIDVHNPTTDRRVGNNDRWRKQAIADEIPLVNQLRLTTHLPVFLIGDFNDRRKAFCPLAQGTSLRAANGGSATATTCTPPPRPRPVDWLFGSIGVRFTSYTQLHTRYVQRTTDHPVVYADVRLTPPSTLVAP